MFESEISRNVFNMGEVLTSASTLVKVLSFLRRVGLYMSWFDLRILYSDVRGEDLLLFMFI